MNVIHVTKVRLTVLSSYSFLLEILCINYSLCVWRDHKMCGNMQVICPQLVNKESFRRKELGTGHHETKVGVEFSTIHFEKRQGLS